MISFFEERSHYLSLPFFFPPTGTRWSGGGQGVSAPYMAAYPAPLSPAYLSSPSLIMCPVRTAPPAKLPTISILYNNPVFFVVPFVSHLALPSLGWGRVHLLTRTRREGWVRCERTHAHTHTRMHRPDILIFRPTLARYTVHDGEYIGLALNYRPLAPTCDTRQPFFSLLPLHLHLSPSTVRTDTLSPTKINNAGFL